MEIQVCTDFFFVEFDVRQKMIINRTDRFGFECCPASLLIRATEAGFFGGVRLVMTHNPSGVDVWSSLQHGTK